MKRIKYPVYVKYEKGEYKAFSPDLNFKFSISTNDKLYAEECIKNIFSSIPFTENIEYPNTIKYEKSYDETLMLVEINNNVKYQRKTITIPNSLNELGIKHNINFSELLVEGVIEVLTNQRVLTPNINRCCKKTVTIPENLNKLAISKNIEFSKILKVKLIEELTELGEKIYL